MDGAQPHQLQFLGMVTGFNTASGMDGAQQLEIQRRTQTTPVSIPQAVWTARNEEKKRNHHRYFEGVSIPQAVWTARNNFAKIFGLITTVCFNTASGMDGAQQEILFLESRITCFNTASGMDGAQQYYFEKVGGQWKRFNTASGMDGAQH